MLRATSLAEVVAWAAGGPPLPSVATTDDVDADAPRVAALDAVRGQSLGKRALLVAAAGAHGLLFHGPPGTGKSLLARALVELLPPPPLEERLAITGVLSASREWPTRLVTRRPFRAPHHTTSYAGLVGGGSPPRPGEITLAHGGVLFLDELPEFRREALEALRQPLESGVIALSRATRRVELPARFQLVCAMNPCPCGFRGHRSRRCHCTPTRCGATASGSLARCWTGSSCGSSSPRPVCASSCTRRPPRTAAYASSSTSGGPMRTRAAADKRVRTRHWGRRSSTAWRRRPTPYAP